MTFLEIAQMVMRRTDRPEAVTPTSTVNQAGREGLIVDFVHEAWNQLQIDRDWSFLVKDFPEYTPSNDDEPGVQVPYRGGPDAAQGVCEVPGTFGMTDLDAWLLTPLITWYDSDVTPIRSDETPLTVLSYNEWRVLYDREPVTRASPDHVSIDLRDTGTGPRLCIGPAPDKNTYRLRGRYRRMPQILDGDGDVPDMPEWAHRTIAWKAMMLLYENDEAGSLPLYTIETNFEKYFNEMVTRLSPGGNPQWANAPVGGGGQPGSGGFGPIFDQVALEAQFGA